MILRTEPLAESHLPRVLEIEVAANAAPWSEASFRHEITHPDATFLVALADGVVAGYGGIWRVVDEAHVTTLAVAPENRRQGIARRLVRTLLQGAKEAGMTCATLEVRAGNEAAIGLYRSFGFEVAGRRKRYYPDNGEDALVMWLYELP